ncbi:MAG TPA: CotH kinase family protein [Candidatus Saccharimonadales bacterium]|nr:CotH kinase family protein [Candidatus Saccharimonadales bacterium]
MSSPRGGSNLGFNQNIILWGLLLLLAAPTTPAASDKAKGEKHPKRLASEAFFTSTNIPLLRITISEEGINELRSTQRSSSTNSRPSVQCTIQEGANIYTNVAVHLKGSYGSFQSVDEKPGMTFNIDKFGKGQTFHGLEKMSLNNSRQDGTYTVDKLSRELYNRLGVPTPRENYVRVSLNRRDLGLYLLVEGWDKNFLKGHFKNTKGNLYDGGFAKDITADKNVNSGETPEDQSDLKALVAAAREKNLKKRFDALNQLLDLDKFVTMLVVDAAMWNWDGYPLNRNNYRVYHDMDQDKLIFMPHGMDQLFLKPEGPLVPAMKGTIAKAAMQIPEVRQRYLDRAAELLRTSLRTDALTNRVMELAARVRPVLQSLKRGDEAQSYQYELDTLLARMAGRIRSLQEQIEGVKSLVKFDGTAPVPITSWDQRNGSTLHVSGTKAQTKQLALNAGPQKVWASTLWLVEGKYRIEGLVKTEKLVPLPDSPGASRRETKMVNGVAQNSVTVANEPGGAGFRVWSQRKLTEGNDWDWFPYRESRNYLLRGNLLAAPGSGKRVSGDSDWTKVSFDFDLRQPVADLHLLFDTRASAGKAILDAESVTIQRLK